MTVKTNKSLNVFEITITNTGKKMSYHSDTFRNRDSYSGSDKDSGKLHIILSNQWFSLIIIKVSQRFANNQFIYEKRSLQKIVI